MSSFKKRFIKFTYLLSQLILLKLFIGSINYILKRKKPDLSIFKTMLINDVLGLYRVNTDNVSYYKDFNLCNIDDKNHLKSIRVYLPSRGILHSIQSYKKILRSNYYSYYVFELIGLSDIIKIIFTGEIRDDIPPLSQLIAKLVIKNKIEAVVLTCEYCKIKKEVIYLLKFNSIPTIALQHGGIILSNPGYFKLNMSDRESLPDITCLYGEGDRGLLLNHSVYTPTDLVVTGSPRNDIIYHADRIYSRDKFCMNYNIPTNHKIILLTTQSHGMTDEENTRQLDIVFGCCDNIPGITLVIKQHPGEKKRHYRMIQSYCRNHSCNPLILPKDSDTFEALYVSDLVITFRSTTGREAVAFNKPLVVLDPQDSGSYCSDGVGVLVSSIQEAKQVIYRLLKDDGELAVNRDKYIKRYFYAIDGKSTERVVQVIEKVLTEKMVK